MVTWSRAVACVFLMMRRTTKKKTCSWTTVQFLWGGSSTSYKKRDEVTCPAIASSAYTLTHTHSLSPPGTQPATGLLCSPCDDQRFFFLGWRFILRREGTKLTSTPGFAVTVTRIEHAMRAPFVLPSRTTTSQLTPLERACLPRLQLRRRAGGSGGGNLVVQEPARKDLSVHGCA